MLDKLNNSFDATQLYVERLADMLSSNEITGKEGQDIKSKSLAALLKQVQQHELEEERLRRDKELTILKHTTQMKELQITLEIEKLINRGDKT